LFTLDAPVKDGFLILEIQTSITIKLLHGAEGNEIPKEKKFDFHN
jgi:hypothetical protein